MSELTIEEKMKYVWEKLGGCWHEFVPSSDPDEGFPECKFCKCRRWHIPENPRPDWPGFGVLWGKLPVYAKAEILAQDDGIKYDYDRVVVDLPFLDDPKIIWEKAYRYFKAQEGEG